MSIRTLVCLQRSRSKLFYHPFHLSFSVFITLFCTPNRSKKGSVLFFASLERKRRLSKWNLSTAFSHNVSHLAKSQKDVFQYHSNFFAIRKYQIIHHREEGTQMSCKLFVLKVPQSSEYLYNNRSIGSH